MSLGFTFEDAQHSTVLVAEQEFNAAVLVRLEAGRAPKETAELGVLTGCERSKHRPLLGHGALDCLYPGDALECLAEVVGIEKPPGFQQLVQDQLQPELTGLVLDDEQQLIVVFGFTEGGVLGAEQVVKVQISAVRHCMPEIRTDCVLDIPDALGGVNCGLFHTSRLSLP